MTQISRAGLGNASFRARQAAAAPTAGVVPRLSEVGDAGGGGGEVLASGAAGGRAAALVAQGVRDLSEVERPGGAVPLASLAERINAEHRACVAAMVDTLNHAYVAGVLLLWAKAGVKHGEWAAWLEKHFDGSDRTARTYMRLARRREEIEEAKRQGSAILSIEGALQHLGRRPGLVGGPDPLVMQTGRASDEVDEKVARAIEQGHQEHVGKEHVWEQADIQAKIGDPSQPASMEWIAEEWSAALARAKEQRITHAGYLVRGVVNHLSRWLDPSEFRPVEAAEALGRMADGDDLIADLRVRSAWLTRVLDEGEAARRREG